MQVYTDKFARRNRPTAEQQAAYRRLVAPGGWNHISLDDARQLATMKYLTVSQREQFAAMVSQAESAVAA